MMSPLIFLFCLTWCLCINVNGAPPIRPVAEVGDAARMLFQEPVSTELTLGGSFSSPEQLENGLWQPHPVSQSWDSSFSSTHNTFSHSELSPFNGRQEAAKKVSEHAVPFTPEQSASASTQVEPESSASIRSIPGRPGLRQSTNTIGILPERNLDIFLSDDIINKRNKGVWKLPHGIDYAPSTWFDATYEHYIASRRARREWTRDWAFPVKTDIPPNVVRSTIASAYQSFTMNSRAYLIRFAGNEANGWQGGDVLTRYVFNDGQGRYLSIRQNTLIVWKTSGHGSRLAFVGLYHCPRPLLKELLGLPGSRKLDVAVHRSGEIHLIDRDSL